MTNHYDSRTIFLHWATAVLVLLLWIAGQCIDFFPKGTPRVTVRSLHISVGAALGVMLFMRLRWRMRGGSMLAAPDQGYAALLRAAMHRLLYLLLIAIVVIGVACVWIRGDNLFNVLTVPAFDPSNKILRHDAVELHGLVANVLLAAAGLHAGVALWHHHIRKDGVLRRMWPGL